MSYGRPALWATAVALCVPCWSQGATSTVIPKRLAARVQDVVSDGVRYLAYIDTHAGIVVRDARTQRSRRFAAPSSCQPVGAFDATILMTCEQHPPIVDAIMLDASTGSLQPVATPNGSDAYTGIGAQWLAGTHCEPQGCHVVYLNRRDGRYRSDVPGNAPRDLNSRSLAVAAIRTRLRPIQGGRHALFLTSHGATRRLSSCLVFCDHVTIADGHVTWNEGVNVRRYDLRTKHTISYALRIANTRSPHVSYLKPTRDRLYVAVRSGPEQTGNASDLYSVAI